MNHLRAQWRAAAKTAMPSWRGLSYEQPYWSDYDAVIVTDANGRGRNFEVYSHGTPWATRHSLDEAKASLEEVYGPLPWKRIAMPKEWAEHYYFGWTQEFGDPTTMLVVDHLPELGKTAAAGVIALIEGFRSTAVEKGYDIPARAKGHCASSADLFSEFCRGQGYDTRIWDVDVARVQQWSDDAHTAASVQIDGEWTIIDWTARQFDPAAPFPEVVPESEWLRRWGTTQRFAELGSVAHHLTRAWGQLNKKSADEVLLYRGINDWQARLVGLDDNGALKYEPYVDAATLIEEITEEWSNLGVWWGDEHLATFHGNEGVVIGAWFPASAVHEVHDADGVIVPEGTKGRVERVISEGRELPVVGNLEITT